MKLAILLSTLLFAVPVLADEPLHARVFYPLAVGSTWTMELDGPQGKVELINSVEGMDEINGKQLVRLTGSINGTVIATEHLEITDKGITRNQFNGGPITPPIVLLAEPIKLGKTRIEKEVKAGGETMAVEVKVAEELEKVTVPAGEYEAVHVTVTAKPAQGIVVSDYWFARGIGIVKQIVQLDDVHVTNSLKSYEIAKDRPEPKKDGETD